MATEGARLAVCMHPNPLRGGRDVLHEEPLLGRRVCTGNARTLNAWSAKSTAARFTDADVYVFLPTRRRAEGGRFKDWICWSQLVRWCLQIWSGVGSRVVSEVETDPESRMSEVEQLVCEVLAFAADMRCFGDWSLCRWYLEDTALPSSFWALIDFDDYRFTGATRDGSKDFFWRRREVCCATNGIQWCSILTTDWV